MEYKLGDILKITDAKTLKVMEVVITKIDKFEDGSTALFVRRKNNHAFRDGKYNIWIQG